MLVIRRCCVSDIETADNFAALMAEYTQESSIQGMPKPDAKWDTYKNLELSKMLHSFGAFIDDMMIGFITVLSPVLPHYSKLVSVTESFFVGHEYRKSGAGLKLLHEAEKCATDLGSPGLLVSAPTGGVLADILPHLGYIETNRVFFRKFS